MLKSLIGLAAALLVKSDARKFRATQSLQYSEDLAMQAHAYSEIVQCDSNQPLLSWTCRYCTDVISPMPRMLNELTDVVVATGGDDKGFVGYDAAEDRIVVSFRNSQGLGQLLDGLSYDLVSPNYGCNGCEVADNFLAAWGEIDEEILAAIESISNSRGTNDVLLTGHSLGGAMATHTAADLLDRYGSRFNIIGYTFGAPRSGDGTWAVWFRNNFPNWFRVTNYEDPIPNWLEDGLVHEAQEIWYYLEPIEGQPPADYRVLSNTNGEDPNGQNSACGSGLFGGCLDFGHHSTYLNFQSSSDFQC
eukprot:snap_masked-scaffold_29-processed-gene-3.22-mRNA-1 protein AED:1.00 eAED:1.00 QI:0/-1/0/0/-1/1/1/0/303